MTRAIRFRRAAAAEFFEAAAHYDALRAGLGREFIEEIERCLTLAARNPQMFERAHKDLRRAVARRFPYSIYFRDGPNGMVVVAVFHGSRDPKVWKSRG